MDEDNEENDKDNAGAETVEEENVDEEEENFKENAIEETAEANNDVEDMVAVIDELQEEFNELCREGQALLRKSTRE